MTTVAIIAAMLAGAVLLGWLDWRRERRADIDGLERSTWSRQRRQSAPVRFRTSED